MTEKHPRILGDFVWAGMDYIGETGEEAGCCELITAGATTCLQMIPEKSTVRPGELLYVRLRYTDEKGILKPMEHHRMQI